MIYFCKNDGVTYECEIIQEGETFYVIKLKNTNEQRAIRKDCLGKLLIDGVCAKTKKEINSAKKQKKEKLYKLWLEIYNESDWKIYDDFKEFAKGNTNKELKRKNINQRYNKNNCYWE